MKELDQNRFIDIIVSAADKYRPEIEGGNICSLLVYPSGRVSALVVGHDKTPMLMEHTTYHRQPGHSWAILSLQHGPGVPASEAPIMAIGQRLKYGTAIAVIPPPPGTDRSKGDPEGGAQA